MVNSDVIHGSSKLLRPALAASQFMAWASAVVVMGIVSYFLAHFAHTEHLIYQEVIGYMAPLGWIFSYLWLTVFIFAAQDYNWHSCAANSPPRTNHCALKKTSESFIFLAFFFTLTNIAIEYLLWDKQRFTGATSSVIHNKSANRESVETASTAAAAV
ncbi:hypothetical protein H2203_001648 [Taxawa tesnikishii (nom. ined.)]|nr:hypothetical protein H2203_001648 [Dothideales sp. JES 119]